MADMKAHVVAIPVPGQGHVKPLMSLCRQIVKHGIKVTVVNAQYIHDKMLNSSTAQEEEEEVEFNDNIVMATVPNGLAPEEDPNDPFTLMEALRKTMPDNLTHLIERINTSNPNERVSCVIADLSFGWVFDIADKMGAEPVGFSPPSVACLAILLHTLKVVEEGSIDAYGN